MTTVATENSRPWLDKNESLERLALQLNDLPPEFEHPLTPVVMTRKAMREDEVKFFIAYGGHGTGKSTYLAKCLSQCYETWDPEVLKRFMVWKPEMFIDVIDYVEKSDKSYMMLGCDDAGVWLTALKWNHPLLSAISEYFDVIRMHFHAIMLTTPWPMHVIKRIRGLPQAVTIKIVKVNSNPNKPREARGYTQYTLPDLKRTGVHPEFVDKFFAVMPEKFYKWYYPARKSFTTQAYQHVKDEIEKYRPQLSSGNIS